jgi:hypothetical protein
LKVKNYPYLCSTLQPEAKAANVETKRNKIFSFNLDKEKVFLPLQSQLE